MDDDKVKSKSLEMGTEHKFYEKIANTPLPEEQECQEVVLNNQSVDTSELELSELSTQYHKLWQDIHLFQNKIRKLFGEDFDYCEVVFKSTSTCIYVDEIHRESMALLNTLTPNWMVTSSDREDLYELKIELHK